MSINPDINTIVQSYKELKYEDLRKLSNADRKTLDLMIKKLEKNNTPTNTDLDSLKTILDKLPTAQKTPSKIPKIFRKIYQVIANTIGFRVKARSLETRLGKISLPETTKTQTLQTPAKTTTTAPPGIELRNIANYLTANHPNANANLLLKIGDQEYCAWSPKADIISIQKKEDYEVTAQTNKIGVQVNTQGDITSVYIDNKSSGKDIPEERKGWFTGLSKAVTELSSKPTTQTTTLSSADSKMKLSEAWEKQVLPKQPEGAETEQETELREKKEEAVKKSRIEILKSSLGKTKTEVAEFYNSLTTEDKTTALKLIISSTSDFKDENVEKFLDLASLDPKNLNAVKMLIMQKRKDLHKKLYPPVDKKAEAKVEEPKAKFVPSKLKTMGVKETGKLFQPDKAKDLIFKPLTQEAVEKLLAPIAEDLKKMPVGNKPLSDIYNAHASILFMHQNGLPFALGKSEANKELIKMMQAILFKINEIALQETKSPKELERQGGLLTELALGLDACVPASMGSINNMYQKVTGKENFSMGFEAFMAVAKDYAIDEALRELYPERSKPEYIQDKQSKKQFHLLLPHMKTGIIDQLSGKLGFSRVGVDNDQNKNTKLNKSELEAFEKKFKEKFNIQNLIKQFVIDVNGKEGQIPKEDFLKWVGEKNQLKKEVYFDNEREYPDYSPPLSTSEGKELAYINEETAVKVFKEMGYVT